MKRSYSVLWTLLLLGVFSQTPVLAVSTSTDSAPYLILPDSPFYFMKAISERVALWFALGFENKAKEYLRLADVRLEEYKRLLEKGKDELAARALIKYEEALRKAQEKLSEANAKQKETTIGERVREAAARQLPVLRETLGRVPGTLKGAVQDAIRTVSELRFEPETR